MGFMHELCFSLCMVPWVVCDRRNDCSDCVYEQFCNCGTSLKNISEQQLGWPFNMIFANQLLFTGFTESVSADLFILPCIVWHGTECMWELIDY